MCTTVLTEDFQEILIRRETVGPTALCQKRKKKRKKRSWTKSILLKGTG